MRAIHILIGLSISLGTASADSTVDRAELRTALAEQRKLHIQRFHEYRKKRIYPHNTYQTGMLNVWRDAESHLCAIATLVHRDGQDDIVDSVAAEHNFIKTADVTEGALLDWILTSGLTQEEVVMIQQPTAAEVEAEERAWRAEQRRVKRAQAREDNRLAKVYLTVERALKEERIADAGLDLATARLAQHPTLAAEFLAAHPVR